MDRKKKVFRGILMSPILWVTTLCLLVHFIKFSSSSLFGQNLMDPNRFIGLAIDLKHPFENAGLPLLLSFFSHTSTDHLLINLSYFWICAFMFPVASPLQFYVRFFGMGLCINLLLVSLAYILEINQGYVMGMSSLIFAMATFSLLLRPKNTYWLMLPIIISLWLVSSGATNITFLGHALGMIVGLSAYLVLHSKDSPV